MRWTSSITALLMMTLSERDRLSTVVFCLFSVVFACLVSSVRLFD